MNSNQVSAKLFKCGYKSISDIIVSDIQSISDKTGYSKQVSPKFLIMFQLKLTNVSDTWKLILVCSTVVE